jgi:hypothetical protein
LLFAAPAVAQDATEADSDHYKVEFENDQVRVLRITYGREEYSAKKGDVAWTDAVTHLPENLTDASAEVILIEFKKKKSEEGCM